MRGDDIMKRLTVRKSERRYVRFAVLASCSGVLASCGQPTLESAPGQADARTGAVLGDVALVADVDFARVRPGDRVDAFMGPSR